MRGGKHYGLRRRESQTAVAATYESVHSERKHVEAEASAGDGNVIESSGRFLDHRLGEAVGRGCVHSRYLPLQHESRLLPVALLKRHTYSGGRIVASLLKAEAHAVAVVPDIVEMSS